MKMLYSMYDLKSESYGPIFALGHDAVAVREFNAVVLAEKSTVAQYADDFELHCLGDFWDDAVDENMAPARIASYRPRVVITARQVLDMNVPPVKLEV